MKNKLKKGYLHLLHFKDKQDRRRFLQLPILDFFNELQQCKYPFFNFVIDIAPKNSLAETYIYFQVKIKDVSYKIPIQPVFVDKISKYNISRNKTLINTIVILVDVFHNINNLIEADHYLDIRDILKTEKLNYRPY